MQTVSVWYGKQARMSGNLAYDFFMGAILNPRVGSVRSSRSRFVLLTQCHVEGGLENVC